jgi:hypothetical protein
MTLLIQFHCVTSRLSLGRISHQAESDMVCTGVRFALAAAACNVAGTILVGAKE